MALLVEKISNFGNIGKIMKDTWSVAPMPQYKEYTDPSDPSCDTVKVAGKTASHSLGYSLAINSGADVTEDRNSPSRGLDIARIGLNFFNMGSQGMSYWMLFDQDYGESSDTPMPSHGQSVSGENIEIDNRDFGTDSVINTEKETGGQTDIYVPKVKEIVISRPVATGKERPAYTPTKKEGFVF